jgi:exosome complex component RRP41
MEKPQLIKNGKRLDGRSFDQLRPIKIVAGVVKNATGSAYLEWGANKIYAAVYGPTEALPKHTANPKQAVIKCRYSMAPFSSLEEHGRSGANRRATEISKVTKEVFENAIMIEKFPNSEIDIYIEVLQSDGGTRAAGITAAGVALADSGIPARDIPFAVSAGKANGEIILDLDKLEDNYSDADMPVAIYPNLGKVGLLQMDGSLTKEEFDKAIGMIKESGREISKIQKAAISEMYE